MNAKQLKEKLAKIAADMRAMHAKAESETRGFTADEDTTWNAMRSDFEATEKALERALFTESKIAGLDEAAKRYITDENGQPVELGRENRGAPEQREQADKRGVVKFCGREVRSDYVRNGRVAEHVDLPMVFDQFLRRGLNGLRPEHRQLVEERFSESDEIRAQSLTNSAGGYTVPQDFAGQVELALKAYSGIRNACTVMQTASGNSLPWPTVNDTTNSGALITENTADSEQDVTFGVATFAAYTFTSRIVRVSMELMQDSGVDIGALLGALLGERLGRATAGYYSTGTGSSQPQGFVAGATLGKTAASATAVTYDELVALKHSVDPAYRIGAKWVMNDAILAVVKGLKDLGGRPLWQPNVAESVPATLDGDAYVIDQGMTSAMTTGQKIVAYGDLTKFVIRDVLGYQLVVLRELYAANRQVGFNMFMRTDSRLINAGTGPIKYLALA